MSNYHPVEVMGVRVEMPSNQPIVLLKELDGVRYLPIWLGAVEATAIAFAQQDVKPPRPLTHDLFKDVLNQLGGKTQYGLSYRVKRWNFLCSTQFSRWTKCLGSTK